FPEMFLHSANFGVAAIDADIFTLAPLNLTLTRNGDTLTGTFAPGKLPVELHRGGTFSDEIDPPDYPAAPPPAWTRDLGAPAWASPATRDGVVYTGTTDGKFHAVAADTGRPLWTWSGDQPLYGEALITNESVCFLDDANHLVSLARADGTLQWRTPLRDPDAPSDSAIPPRKNETFNHRAASPIVDPKGTTLYIGANDGGVYAVRATNGRILWRHDARAPIYAPLLLRGNDLIVGCFDGSVFTLNTRRRRESARTKLGGAIVSAPVVAGNRLVIGSRDYLLYGLDAATHAVAWKNSFWFSWVESTPRLVDGLLYIGGSDFRRVSAIDPATGRRKWATDVRGLSWGSPIVAATTVYAGTTGQNIAGTVIQHTGSLVALDRETGAPRWRYLSPVATNTDFVGFTGSLVLAGDHIIGAQVDGTLIAFPIANR
ncbi:MAG TPA: PQQ-binding-like beta-propeller repeat protein, partial [Opitutus sp.]|nr:PQQ-binding-like beta-propeller repeat protein [Opitutus sp.]